ncbi:MAG: protein kinase domain-containing protein [Planctomycetota bacterium]
MAFQQGAPGLTGYTDRFEAISPLGRGGMGEVWLVRDRNSGELVSLKKIDAEQVRSPLGQRLRREFLHLKKLSHPSILRVHDFGVSPKTGETWFTSEVLRGPVSTEIAGQITLQQWWQMSVGFLRALSFMHRNRWVHGDIKPDNIRLRADVTEGALDPVLLDFGLSRQEHLAAEEKILGTPQSMAPEQWLGQPPQLRSDVYSAGVLLYHWWTGDFPFDSVVKPLLSSAHLHDEVPPLANIRRGLPPDVEKVIMKMLAKKPDDRHAHAGEALFELSMILRQGEVSDAESRESLLAQVEYAGTGNSVVTDLAVKIERWLKRSSPEEVMLHLHSHESDRRWIVDQAKALLQSKGWSILSLDSQSEDPFSGLSQGIESMASRVVVLVENPDPGNPHWQRLLKVQQWKEARLHWWISSREAPSGFIGEALAGGGSTEISTCQNSEMLLEPFLEMALPGCSIPTRVRSRLQSWGQEEPGMWRRILKGRIQAGELTHDGLRWNWQPSIEPPEERWKFRSQEQLSGLPASCRRILESLAVLGRPASVSELSRLVQLSGGDFPARVSELSSKNWLSVGRRIEFRRVFQQEAVLASLSSADRQSIHKRVLEFEQRSFLEKAHHQLSSGDVDGATNSLKPLLEKAETPVPFEEASRWIPVLSSLIHMLPEKRQRPWLEVLGQMEDRCGHGALRDHAWRQAAAGACPGSSEALRLTRWRASVQRRDGETRKALSCIEEVSKQAIDFSCPRVVKEATLVALEYSRIQRAIVRQGLGKLPKRDPLAEWIPRCKGSLRTSLILEQCRRYLLQGSRLRARDHARIALRENRDGRIIAEAMGLLARAQNDLPSLRLWSRLHSYLARREHRHEAATAAEVDSVEALQRMGETLLVNEEVHGVIDRARKECPAQLPRALLVKAREEAGAGFIRSASRLLEEAMTLEGPAGIVAWEGNLLVAASEWVAGRSNTALRILDAASPEWAPHEPERIDVHARHSILKSRCLRSQGDLSGSLFVVDHALTQLRLRGVDSDLISLRRERVSILKILGRNSLARMEERKLRGARGSEPGLDPEPGGSRRAKAALEDLLRQFSRGTEECEDWENGLERVALEALRLRIQPLSLRIQLARTLSSPHPDPEALIRQCWKKAVRLPSREGRAMVLSYWSRLRCQKGDSVSARALEAALQRELDRWCQQAPEGTSRSTLSEWLGVHDGQGIRSIKLADGWSK